MSDEEFREYRRIESYALLGCLNEWVRIFNVFNMSDFSTVLNIYGKTLRNTGQTKVKDYGLLRLNIETVCSSEIMPK